MNCKNIKKEFFVRFMLLWETMQNTFKEFQFLTLRAVLFFPFFEPSTGRENEGTQFICWLLFPQRGFLLLQDE
jgi:hypothetical protein